MAVESGAPISTRRRPGQSECPPATVPPRRAPFTKRGVEGQMALGRSSLRRRSRSQTRKALACRHVEALIGTLHQTQDNHLPDCDDPGLHRKTPPGRAGADWTSESTCVDDGGAMTVPAVNENTSDGVRKKAGTCPTKPTTPSMKANGTAEAIDEPARGNAHHAGPVGRCPGRRKTGDNCGAQGPAHGPQ